MTFTFSRHGLSGRAHALQRVFEIVPGALSWTILLSMLVLAFWKPVWAAVLIIAFDLYWLLRLFYMTLFLVLSYGRLSIERDTDWMARLRGVDQLDAYRRQPRPRRALLRRISDRIHRQELDALAQAGLPPPPSEEIYHLILYPIASEGRRILEPGLQSLAAQTFPASRLLVVLAVEARSAASVQQDAAALAQAYRSRFLDVLVVLHPDGLPGEAPVKGANATYAARAAAGYFGERRIPFNRIIASCFDADTVVSPAYIACLTYHFLVCPQRDRASFQPIPVYHNNIWNAPGFARVLDIGSSFFQLVEATNPQTLVTFSSHSMSFDALVAVGYWPVDMISDDSAIFWKSWIHYDGRYRVVPLYVTLSMDIAVAQTWRRTVANVYKQKRRWAWGVENFPIIARALLQADRIPWPVKCRAVCKLLESHVGWATWAFLLTVIGWLPAWFSGLEFSSSVLYYSAPRITGIIFQLASLALVATILLSLLLLPPNPKRRSLWSTVGHALEWLLVPLVAVLLGAVPALDAQTRLMAGRYMEFWVTEKIRPPRQRR